MISSALYSLTALEGSMAISALARKVFFSFAGSEARYGAY
ncbi:hypothetical protein BSPLISOX_1163 [uncultured Gammaproteobacteria bacterium]|nr:hypothetical protein [uncultured Gammaproteobacteria bacterium]VVH65894.1 hypothetical protein BSPLISOX_1163 [uncultured Gammaproteobacteria bacterium]